jgi:hypothetical protein
MLRALLVEAIDACAVWGHRDGHGHAGLDPALWAAVCGRPGGLPAAAPTSPDTPASR